MADRKRTARAAFILLALLVLVSASLYRRPWVGSRMIWLSGLGWLAFNFYWGAAAKNSSKAKKSESAESRRVHQYLLLSGLLFLFVTVPGLRWRFLPLVWFVPVAGLVLQAACGAFGVWARRHLGAHWSGEITIKEEHRLIRSGPYRLVRHPMYTAWLGMYAGPAIVSGEAHALLGLLLAVVAYWRKIRLEEAVLIEGFGAEYAAYRRQTWKLLPGLF